MVSRFAPSPTGLLHIGHAWSALFSHALGQRESNGFILRVEDIDQTRCRPEYTGSLYADLEWLGLEWPRPVRVQSEHFETYQSALDRLRDMGLLYRCYCTRAEIQNAASAPHGPEGVIYPGTCRGLDRQDDTMPYALRLDMAAAIERVGKPLVWHDLYRGAAEVSKTDLMLLGDVVLARKDTPASYHLCVCIDDHAQGVDLVTRGEDLLHATPLHRLLQYLLDLDVPRWAHHPLLLDENGQRFAKRNHAVTLKSRRDSGKSPADIQTMIAAGLPPDGPWKSILKMGAI